MISRQKQIKPIEFTPRKLKDHEKEIRDYYAKELKSHSLFLLPVELDDSNSMANCEYICEQILTRLNGQSEKVVLSNFTWTSDILQNHSLQLILFQNESPENIKNEIVNIIQSPFFNETQNSHSVRINKYGLFIPREGAITCYSFAHGQGHYYRYRLATFKLDVVPSQLRYFLSSLSSNCPDKYFLSGPRASNFEVDVSVKIEKTEKHDLVQLAQNGLKVRKLKSAHEDIEKYLLECDPKTIACEIPIWFEPSEVNQYIFIESNLAETLTGHIDALRIEPDGKIGIWDYKPAAAEERMAHVQVFLYALMLSKRTNIPLEQFCCGYFDENIAFFYNASEVLWHKIKMCECFKQG